MDKLSNTLTDKQVKESELSTATETTTDPAPTSNNQDPTRFGDWEKNGRCVDF